VQVFDEEGRYQSQWNNLHRPCALCTQAKKQPLTFIAEIGPPLPTNRDFPNLGPRISIVDHRGALVARLGDQTAGLELGRFLGPHGITVDSHGDIYIGELGAFAWKQLYPQQPVPDKLPNLKKLVRVRPS
jgi:hypothetical protein